MASFRRILHNISRIDNDNGKFGVYNSNIDESIGKYIDNMDNKPSKQIKDSFVSFLKQEKINLQSIDFNINMNDNDMTSSNILTPNRNFNNKTKPRFSSLKKPRPRIRKTPLKPLKPVQPTFVEPKSSEILQNNNTNNMNMNNIENMKKVPQKKLTLTQLNTNAIKKPSINIANNSNNNNNNDNNRMDIDNDSDSENDENIVIMAAPNNGKSFVDMKIEQDKLKKNQKSKPKVDALQKAKIMRKQQENREKERKRLREENKKAIAENKRKKKLREQQQNQQKTMKQRNNINPSKNIPKIKKQRFKIEPNTNSNHSNHSNNGNSNSHNNNHRNARNVKKTTNDNNDNRNRSRSKSKSKKSEPTQYALSDYDSEFSDSDVDEEACSKFIPPWARRSKPKEAMKKLKAIDPDTIFGRMLYKSCDLEILFADWPSRTKYRQRSASGDWTKDQSSWAEENSYKKDMGWI